MIYLIQDCYKDETGYHDVLKIGYSDKGFEESRGKEYNTHNFGYRLLEERDGDKDLEAYLHKYFNKYRLSREWFEYDEKIVNMFLDIELPENEEKYRDEDDPVIFYPKTDYLKTAYRRKIIDPDFLLGTDESIDVRISRSIKIAERFWQYLEYNGDDGAEEILDGRLKTTESLLRSLDSIDEQYRQAMLEKFYNLLPSAKDYLYISGKSFGEYKAMFDEGKYKIEKLALELFRQEILKI